MVEKQLKKLIREFQEGKHEGSIKTIATVDSLTMDDKQTWRAIRKEFENMGISVAAFDANKRFIMGWFQKAFESGAFEECVAEDDENSISSQNTLSYDTLEIQEASAENLVSYEPTNSTPNTTHINVAQDPVLTSSASTPPPTPPNRPMRETLPMRNSAALVNSRNSPDQAKLVVDPRPEKKISSSRSEKPLELPKSVVPKKQPRVVTLVAWALRHDKAFHEACRHEEIDKAKSLLEKGADVNSIDTDGSTALQVASLRWDAEVVRFLLENGADVRAIHQSRTALHLAAGGIGGRRILGTPSGSKVCDLLLKYGAALDGGDLYGQTALCLASLYGHPEIVKTLLDYGADNIKGSPLKCATQYRHIDIARLLLDRQTWSKSLKREEINLAFLSCFLSLRNLAGITIGDLFEPDLIPLVRLLLEHGANPNSLVNNGDKALCSAVSRGHSKIAKILLEHGADPNSKMRDGKSALLCALTQKRDGVALLLIERGASVRKQGEHLVVEAVKGNCKEALKAMLTRGASFKENDTDGHTTLDIAHRNNNPAIAQVLINHGAIIDPKKWVLTSLSGELKFLEAYDISTSRGRYGEMVTSFTKST